MRPSEIFRRNCWISFEPVEGSIGALAEYIGPHKILWATDYPHRDGFFPGAPLDRNRADLDQAWGGFALEISDTTGFIDFTAFQKHIAEAKVETSWDAASKVVNAAYRSGNDTLEAGTRTLSTSGGGSG